MQTVTFKMNGLTYNNYRLIRNLDEYSEFLKELNNKFTLSDAEIKDRHERKYIGHDSTLLTSIAEFFSINDIEPLSLDEILLRSKILYGRVLSDQLKDICNGCSLAINDKGGYFPIKITDHIYIVSSNDIKEFTVKDIKISRWANGRHFYAKVGNIDVVDSDGNVKWNTHYAAKRESNRFLEKLNNSK